MTAPSLPALIFDLDGTLVDTAPDLLGAMNGVLIQQGRRTVDPETLRHMVGFGAASLILGAAVAYVAKLGTRVTAAIMSFGCGILIAAVAYDLIFEGFRQAGIRPIIVGAITGSIAYALANWLVSRNGARHRKRSGGQQTDASEGGGMAIAIGSLLDGMPESVVLGVSLLGGGGAAGFRHHRDNPLPYDLIVVDEASMIDVALAAHLLDALAPGARLVLLGDKDQLAAVEAGAVFAELSARPTFTAAARTRIAQALGIDEAAFVAALPVPDGGPAETGAAVRTVAAAGAAPTPLVRTTRPSGVISETSRTAQLTSPSAPVRTCCASWLR